MAPGQQNFFLCHQTDFQSREGPESWWLKKWWLFSFQTLVYFSCYDLSPTPLCILYPLPPVEQPCRWKCKPIMSTNKHIPKQTMTNRNLFYFPNHPTPDNELDERLHTKDPPSPHPTTSIHNPHLTPFLLPRRPDSILQLLQPLLNLPLLDRQRRHEPQRVRSGSDDQQTPLPRRLDNPRWVLTQL